MENSKKDNTKDNKNDMNNNNNNNPNEGLNIDLEELEKMLDNNDLSDDERLVLETILDEIADSDDGRSTTLDFLYNVDFVEVPVNIDTFLENKDYLGNVYDEGKNIYPYWRQVLRDIFNPNISPSEVIFTGAIGLGKSEIASIGLAYVLYYLLCMRNPARYFGLPESATIGIAIINITLELAYAVGYTKLMSILKQSPWFLRNGKIKGKDGLERYIPNKNIVIIPASKARHTIGKDICCMIGDTEILTKEFGWKKLIELSKLSNNYSVASLGRNKLIWNSNHLGVKSIGSPTETLKFELETGDIIEVSFDHKFKVNGKWKRADELLEGEEIDEINIPRNI